MVSSAGRARLANNTFPAPTPLPEADVADMEFFLEQLQMMLPVIGFSFLQRKPVAKPDAGGGLAGSPMFRIESVGVKAEAREIDGEFVVLKGSTARKEEAQSWASFPNYRSLRSELIESGKLVDGTEPNVYVFAEDVPFASPSAAATVVRAANTNGRREWKEVSTGKSYAEWKELQLKLAGVDEGQSPSS